MNTPDWFTLESESPSGISIEQRLSVIEDTLANIQRLLENRRPEKDWYTVAEIAEIFDKAEWTVREWCRLGRVNAAKRECGRGNSKEWIVSREELERIDNDGLLPM